MTNVVSKLRAVLPPQINVLDACEYLLPSMLPSGTTDSFIDPSGYKLSEPPQGLRRELRAWLFGDPPGIHQAVSIGDLDFETIAGLDPRATLLLAERIFDVADDLYARRLQVVRKIKAGRFDSKSLKEFAVHIGSEKEYARKFSNALLSSRQDCIFKIMISSWGQSIAFSRAFAEAKKDATTAQDSSLSRSIEELEELQMPRCVVYEGKGFEVSYARRELAIFVTADLLPDSSDSCWNGKILEMHLPRDGNLLMNTDWRRVSWWPPSNDDPHLKAFERILGWKFDVLPLTKDLVKITIDFGDTYWEEA